MLVLSPSTCPICRPHQDALQPYLDGAEDRSVGDVLAALRHAVDDIRSARCGVPPERLLLPAAIRLLLREDVDDATRSSLMRWVDSL